MIHDDEGASSRLPNHNSTNPPDPKPSARSLKIEVDGDVWKRTIKPKIRLNGRWLERAGFAPGARDFGLPASKGLLIVGVPGTGKSLTAKVTAKALGVPLLKLEIGRIFGGLVGQSEGNLRAVLQTAEAVASRRA